MGADRELIYLQKDRYFDLLELWLTQSEHELRQVLLRQMAKAETLLSDDEAEAVVARPTRARAGSGPTQTPGGYKHGI